MAGIAVALCPTRERLYEEVEKNVLKLLEHRKGRFTHMQTAKVQDLSARIAHARERLREHERNHRCHLSAA